MVFRFHHRITTGISSLAALVFIGAGKSVKSKQELLEIALGHIADIAGDGRPARRLDWIVARAKTALRGEEFDHRYMPHPIRQQTVEMGQLRKQCDELREMLENLANRAATGSPEHLDQDIDRARTIVEQNWHHIKRYREKQNSRDTSAD